MKRYLALSLVLYLVAGCGFELPQIIQKVEGKERYRGIVLLVSQTESGIVVENTSSYPVAIRLSWDKRDPWGTGAGEDSFIDNWVPAGERVSQPFKEHSSVQIWAWGTSGSVVDSCSLSLSP
jgi:hypothetical protein